MGTETKVETNVLVGYQFGTFYKTRLHSKFWFSAEANFSIIGSGKKVVGGDGKVYDAQEKLGYMEIPLTIQYKPADIYFGAGPSIGLKLFSKFVNVGGNSYDIPYYRTLDAGASLLAGYSFSKKLDVNLRYNHGLMTISKEPGTIQTKNRFLNLSLLYPLK